MYEKISDKSIREEKVKRLKTKILVEIDKKLDITKDEMESYLSDNDAFDYLVRISFALLNLKDYIEREDTFQSYEAQYFNEDIVIYMVSDRDLEIWLQNYYNFTFNFLYEAERCGFDIFPLLNDRYFGYNFTNIFDGIAYDRKREEKKLSE